MAFDEAVTAYGDPLSVLLPDPDHSVGEERYLVLGMSTAGRLLVVAFVERPPPRHNGITKVRTSSFWTPLMDVFPDSEAVNEALRALAPVLRRRKRA